jgi:flavin reductase (DIM6/NTAB) family NADH-FMN oxidoreductase RutF
MNAAIPGAAYLSFDMNALSAPQRYKLFMGSVIPRPIALVSTLSGDGHVNAAPFSNFMVVSSAAGILAFACAYEKEDRAEKDTLVNVRARGEFVVNTVPVSLVQQVQQCAESFPPEVSEVEIAGLHLLPSTQIATPRIAESKVQFECRLDNMQLYGETQLIFGKVLAMHVREEIFDDYRIRCAPYAPAGRLGGRVYCSLGELIEV